MESSIKVGISSCVLGERVRFDSGHKVSNFVTKELSNYFDFVSVCPEGGGRHAGATPDDSFNQ